MKFNKAKFRELREKSGLTLDEIAKKCKVSKQTVQKWEKHPTLQPLPKKILMLYKILNCKAGELADYGTWTATIKGITGSLQRIDSMVREMPRECTGEEAAELMKTAAGLMITICKFYEGIKP